MARFNRGGGDGGVVQEELAAVQTSLQRSAALAAAMREKNERLLSGFSAKHLGRDSAGRGDVQDRRAQNSALQKSLEHAEKNPWNMPCARALSSS